MAFVPTTPPVNSARVSWLDHPYLVGVKVGYTEKLLSLGYPMQGNGMSVSAFLGSLNSISLSNDPENPDAKNFQDGAIVAEALMKVYESCAVRLPNDQLTQIVACASGPARADSKLADTAIVDTKQPTLAHPSPQSSPSDQPPLEIPSQTMSPPTSQSVEPDSPVVGSRGAAPIDIPQVPEESFESLWARFKTQIEQVERDALSNPTDDHPIIKYHRKSGTYPYLSENYPSPVLHDDMVWPTAQHAFQAAKLPRDIPNRRQRQEDIKNEKDLKKVREAGRKIEWEPQFNNDGHRLEVMFRIIYSKFQQQRSLAIRLLHDTKDKPIWHMFDDNFWGTSRTTSAAAEAAAASGRSSSMRTTSRTNSVPKFWWNGDNWNGKILSVVRILLRQKITLSAEAIKAEVEAEMQQHCPFPNEFLNERDKYPPHRHDAKLKKGTLIAGMYKVEREVVCKGLGAFVGTYCYICEDESPCDPSEEETIRECLASDSLRDLRECIQKLVIDLCGEQGASRDADWGGLFKLCNALRQSRFFGQKPRRWWIALEENLQNAQNVAEVQLKAGQIPRRAAYTLQLLLPSSPLVLESSRPRVFVKTFKEYNRRAYVEIRRCSSKAPDFGRDLLQDHPNLSAIFGGSHAGSLSDSNKRLAFVALENCEGQDLFDFTSAASKLVASDAAVMLEPKLRFGIFLQVADAVRHLHQNGIVHGDLKPDNIVVGPSGKVKLIDYGGMTLVDEVQDAILCPGYASPELQATHCRGHSEPIEKVLKGNDVWMLSHVLLVLSFRHCMPTKSDGKLKYPCEACFDQGAAVGTRRFDSYLDESTSERLKGRISLPVNNELRALLGGMYADIPNRLTAEGVRDRVEKLNPSAKPESDLPPLLTKFFASDVAGDFLPDLELVHLAEASGVTAGFLVCWVGSSVSAVQEGDVITRADGRRLAVDEDALHALMDASDSEGVSKENLCRWNLCRDIGGEKEASAVFDKLFTNEIKHVDREEVKALLDNELPKALLGKYNSAVKLTLWRQTAAGEYVMVPDEVECQRIRNARQRAPAKTPERFRGFLLWKDISKGGQTAWQQVNKAGDKEGLLTRLEKAFSEWQQAHEASAAWVFTAVLATWVRKGLVDRDTNTGGYRFVPDKWQ